MGHWRRAHMSKSKLSAELNLHLFLVRTCHLHAGHTHNHNKAAATAARHKPGISGTKRSPVERGRMVGGLLQARCHIEKQVVRCAEFACFCMRSGTPWGCSFELQSADMHGIFVR